MTLTFKQAAPTDIPLLTETAFASKSTWGYPAEWMEMWWEQIAVSEEFILQNEVVKAFAGARFIGFYILVDLGEKTWDLDAFWIVPGEMGKGYGKQIFVHVMEFLHQQKAEKLEVVTDPNANGFYEKMGGKWARKFPSKPERRELDVYEYKVV